MKAGWRVENFPLHFFSNSTTGKYMYILKLFYKLVIEEVAYNCTKEMMIQYLSHQKMLCEQCRSKIVFSSHSSFVEHEDAVLWPATSQLLSESLGLRHSQN